MVDKENAFPVSSADTVAQLPLVVGVDLGGTQIRVAVLRGTTILSRVDALTGDNSFPDRVIPRMIQAVRKALSDAGVALDDVAGIGIGAPGPLDGHTGIVFSPPNLSGWVNVPLRQMFVDEFHVPVFLENDANAAALGEYMFGAGRGSHEVAYVTVSTGIGCGVIADGRLISGVCGTALELGHMTIDIHGPVCNCGNIGCLEALASGTAIARWARECIKAGRGAALKEFVLAHPELLHLSSVSSENLEQSELLLHINARVVAAAAIAHIPEACEIITSAAEALGFGLVNVVHLFNPERIILGGGVSQMGEILFGPANQILQRHTMPVPKAAMSLVMAELGSNVGLIGAGALVYYQHDML